MGAQAGTSLFMHVGLLGVGFLMGRIPFLSLGQQLIDELWILPTTRKVVIVVLLVILILIYVVGFLLPLQWVAAKEADALQDREECFQPSTSFRRELRRRGSYSLSYVTDIKAHVFART